MLCLGALTLSPCKAEKLASPTVTNSHKAEIPACRSLINSRKAAILAWNFRKKRLQIMLCLGAPGLGTPCCASSGVRGLKYHSHKQNHNEVFIERPFNIGQRR